ncbi:unnamed protein product, partial [Symbiodinium sp. KB8]
VCWNHRSPCSFGGPSCCHCRRRLQLARRLLLRCRGPPLWENQQGQLGPLLAGPEHQKTLRGPPSLVLPVDSSWHGVDTQGRWRRVEVGVEDHHGLVCRSRHRPPTSHCKRPPGHGSYFSADCIQKMHTPPTSSSSTSQRGPEKVRGKHGVLHFAHCQSVSSRSPLAVRAPEARVCGCGLGGGRHQAARGGAEGEDSPLYRQAGQGCWCALQRRSGSAWPK